MQKIMRWTARLFLIFVILLFALCKWAPDLVGYAAGLIGVLMLFYFLFCMYYALRLMCGKPLSAKEQIREERKVQTIGTLTGEYHVEDYMSRTGARVLRSEIQVTYQAQGKTYTKWYDLSPAPLNTDLCSKGVKVEVFYDYYVPDQFEVGTFLVD